MSEQLQLLTEIAHRLETAGIPYMVTGSMALTFHANPSVHSRHAGHPRVGDRARQGPSRPLGCGAGRRRRAGSGAVLKDTPPEVEARYRELIMRKTPTQRLAMASDMWDAAKEMMIAGIHARRGPLSPVELRVELFLQLYGHEFSDERRAQIVAGLRLRK